MLLAALAVAGEWTDAVWRGEPALAATAAAWTATVSLPRARLVSLRHRDDGELLHADDAPLAVLVGARGVLGGHVTWLGPQRDWWWPPPRAWEALPPAAVAEDASGWLHLDLAPAEGWPGLRRSYRWRDGVLQAAIAWQAPGRHAVHILQVPAAGEVTLVDDAGRSLGLPHDCFAPLPGPPDDLGARPLGDGRLRIVAEGGRRKHLLPPRAITCRLPWGGSLTLAPAAFTGQSAAVPDRGLLTQVYADPAAPFLEIEQLSPASAGAATATVELRPDLIVYR